MCWISSTKSLSCATPSLKEENREGEEEEKVVHICTARDTINHLELVAQQREKDRINRALLVSYPALKGEVFNPLNPAS